VKIGQEIDAAHAMEQDEIIEGEAFAHKVEIGGGGKTEGKEEREDDERNGRRFLALFDDAE
jgi:hypothetical protein